MVRPWEAFLPVKWENAESTYKWSYGLKDALHSLSQGPLVSDVCSGGTLAKFFLQVADPGTDPHAAAGGLAFYFDQQVEPEVLTIFFEKTLPRMAELAVRLPKLLVKQTEYSKKVAETVSEILKYSGEGHAGVGVLLPLSLQIMHHQQPGIIWITQQLAASLLSCAFFCLFPISERDNHRLPEINMDQLFASLSGVQTPFPRSRTIQIDKLHCLINYFNLVCESMPQGTISYERKVLSVHDHETFWSVSHTPLCSFECMDQGVIEDAGWEYAQVDFATRFLGGGVLKWCWGLEFRFTLNPELIVGMLFLPVMADNETIEITGSEKFSDYAGHFHFAGKFTDSTPRDAWGRRRTKIIAMDAARRWGEKMYPFQPKHLLREVGKAYCGFLTTEKVASNICEGTKFTTREARIRHNTKIIVTDAKARPGESQLLREALAERSSC